jgi:hypothetical protein
LYIQQQQQQNPFDHQARMHSNIQMG